jgi:hypothetical protein
MFLERYGVEEWLLRAKEMIDCEVWSWKLPQRLMWWRLCPQEPGFISGVIDRWLNFKGCNLIYGLTNWIHSSMSYFQRWGLVGGSKSPEVWLWRTYFGPSTSPLLPGYHEMSSFLHNAFYRNWWKFWQPVSAILPSNWDSDKWGLCCLKNVPHYQCWLIKLQGSLKGVDVLKPNGPTESYLVEEPVETWQVSRCCGSMWKLKGPAWTKRMEGVNTCKVFGTVSCT